ncbi:MAG: hypothetical protein H7240_02270 [Glaciimonas sp.]|nr:hypothetical protein [Glaciimonas sp.]
MNELKQIYQKKEYKPNSAKFINNTFDKYEMYTRKIEASGERSCFAILVNNDSLYSQFSPETIFIISKDEELCDRDVILIKISMHNPCIRKIFIDGNNFLFTSISIRHEIFSSIYTDYKLISVVLKAIKTFSER